MAAAVGTEAVVATAHVYRDASRGIYSGLQAFLNDPRLSDIVLVRPDGRQIHVHQVILAACSRRFASLLSNGDATGKELPVQGVDSAALESVIGFFYRGECLLTQTTVLPIYDVCLKLDVPGLAAGCEQYLQQNLNAQTCPGFLEASVQLVLEQTIKQCLDYAKSRFDDVVASTGFQSLGSESVRLLLKYCRSTAGEMGLARALARWAVRRPEHLAECEAMFKELKITTTILLQLLQSPDFLAGLHTANPVPAEHEAPARTDVGGAAATAAATSSMTLTGGSGSAAARTVINLAVKAGASGSDAVLSDSHAVLVTGEITANHVLNSQQLSGGVRSRQLQQVFPVGQGSAICQKSPGGSSAVGGAGTEGAGGGGLVGRTDRDNSGGRPPAQASQFKGELGVSNFEEVGDAKRRPSSGDPASVQQQQQGFRLRKASREDGGATTDTRHGLDIRFISQPVEETGRMEGASGDGSDRYGASMGHATGTPRVGKVEATGAAAGTAAAAATRLSKRLAVSSLLTSHPDLWPEATATITDDADDACLRSKDGDGVAGDNGLFAVPLSALEQAGLTLHLLPSGMLAATDGMLGSKQLPLQVVSTGAMPQAPLLALLPKAIVRQLHPPPSRSVADALSRVERELQRQPGNPPQPTAPPSSATMPFAAQQQHRRVLTIQPRDIGLGSDGIVPQVPLLLEIMAGGDRAGGDLALKRDLGAKIVDLPALGLVSSTVGICPRGTPLLYSGRCPSSSRIRTSAAELAVGSFSSTCSPGFGAPAAAAAAAAVQHPCEDDVGGLRILSAAAVAGGPLAPAATSGRGGQAGATFVLGNSSDELAAGNNGKGLPLLPLQYSSARLSTGPPQAWSMSALGESSSTAKAVAVTAAAASQLAASRAAAVKQASIPSAWDDDTGAAANSAVIGSGSGKRRRPSPEEDDSDHVDDTNVGVVGGGSIRVTGGAGGGRGGGRSAHGGRGWHDGGQGGVTNGSKGPLMCHVDGCHVDLSNLKEYHQRFRICDFHLKAETVMREGVAQRFCQQCGRFHILSEFDGTKRSCRARLQRHNARRRKRPEQRGSGGDKGGDEPRKARRSPTHAVAGGSAREVASQPSLHPLQQVTTWRDSAVAAGHVAPAPLVSPFMSSEQVQQQLLQPLSRPHSPRAMAVTAAEALCEGVSVLQKRNGQPAKLLNERITATTAAEAAVMPPVASGGLDPSQLDVSDFDSRRVQEKMEELHTCCQLLPTDEEEVPSTVAGEERGQLI